LVTQEFQIVGGEVDDQEATARTQYACGLAQRAGAVVEEVQHLVNDHDIEAAGRERQIVDVAMTHSTVLQSGTVEAGAGKREHIERQVEPKTALDPAGEQLQHASRAGAEIEKRADRPVAERRT